VEAEAAVAMEGVEEGEGLLHAHQLAGRGVARGVARGLRWGGGGGRSMVVWGKEK
jgi:hypothetical protein